MEVLLHKLPAHVQAKVLRREWGDAEGWFSAVETGAWATELASGRVGRVPALAWWYVAEESFDFFVEIVKESKSLRSSIICNDVERKDE